MKKKKKMDLAGIISISGKPGLYKVISQGKNNLIVESLDDSKRFPSYASDKVSSLEEISVYTYDEDMALKSILKSIYIKENGGLAPSHKESKAILEAYMLEILPNYDQERVYFSDIKKILQWYNQLHKTGLLTNMEENTSEDSESQDITENKTEEVIEETIKSEVKKPRKKPETTIK